MVLVVLTLTSETSNHMNDSTSAVYKNGHMAPSVAPTIRMHEDSQVSMFQRTSKAVVITGM